MKILLVSPLVISYTPATMYAGIEKLVYQYVSEFSKEHEVSVIGREDSVYPEKVTHIKVKAEGELFAQAEAKAYMEYNRFLRNFDVIHDFSHSHLVARYNNLPTVNPFWHAPSLGQYPKAPYNIIALSQWAAREFKRIYHQNARYVQSIVVDASEYHTGRRRGDRFLTIGKMSPEKGNLAAVMLCKMAGVPLDIAGGRGIDKNLPLTDYEKEIQKQCDGEQIQFLGEVSDEDKIKLMQRCRALIYITAPGYEEVSSHKIQESMFCGSPIITTPAGALPEIITHGIDGFLCNTDKEFLEAIKSVDKLDVTKTLESNIKKYSLQEVCSNYVELYREVKGGLRW